MHLDDSILDDYLSRSLDRERLNLLDDHVATCFACSLTVEARGLEPARWERRGPFGRLARVAPPSAARAELDRAA